MIYKQKKINHKIYEQKGSRGFEVFKNAMSVGWHLRKIQEADPHFMDNIEDFKRFIEWLKRHKLIK